MKRFCIQIIKTGLFFLTAVLLTLIISSFPGCNTLLGRLTNSMSYVQVNTGPSEILPFIEKARTPDSATKLIVGDSVCRQLFNGLEKYNPEICICGTNAAISTCGQYVLISEYLRTHQNVTDVFLIMSPGSLASELNTEWSYPYAVMPFAESGTLHLMHQKTLQQMRQRFGSLFLKDSIVNLIDRSPMNRKLYLNLQQQLDRTQGEPLFSMADLYIPLLYDMCKNSGIAFHLLPTPQAAIDNENTPSTMETAYYTTKTSQLFPDFYSQICTYPKEMFHDGVHFSGEYAQQEELNKRITEMYLKTGLISELRLDSYEH